MTFSETKMQLDLCTSWAIKIYTIWAKTKCQAQTRGSKAGATYNYEGLWKSLKCSVVAKKLGSQLKINLRWLKEGTLCLMLTVEVAIVLYQAIASQKSSRWSLHFQPVNFTSSQSLATTLKMQFTCSAEADEAVPICWFCCPDGNSMFSSNLHVKDKFVRKPCLKVIQWHL